MKTKKNIIVILIAVLMIFSHCVTAAASEGAANRRTVTTEDNDEEKRPEKEEKEEKEEDTEKEEKEEKEEDPKKEETEDDPKKEETEEKEEDTEKEEEGPDEGETEGDDETEGEGEGETEGEGDTDGEKEGPAAPKLFAEGENFRIGEDGTSYAKLEDAAAAVEDGETIYMLTDVEVAAYDILDVAKTYTIDLGGHELSSDATLTLKISGGNVTIQNGYLSNQWMAAISVGGSPKVTLSGLNVSCIGVYDADFAVLLEGSGEVDILSGEYHGGKHAVNVADGKVTITGGRFTSDNSAALYAYDPNFISIANGSAATREDWLNNSGVQEVTVSPIPNFDNAFLSGLYYQVGDGETIAVPDFEQNKYEYTILLPGDTSLPAVINLYPEPVASGATITSDTAVTLPGVDETVKVTVRAMDETTTKTYSLRFRIMAQNFQIDDGRYYNDLEDAVRDVEDGGTIVMLKDVEVRYGIQLNNIDKDCVIDLGGNTIIVPDFTSLFSIQNSAGTVEFKNGKIESAGINCIFIEGSTVILSYLTVSATGGDNQYAVNTKDSDVTIRGGSYFGYNSAVNYDGGSVTIYTGTFKSTGRAALAEVEGGNISIAPGYFPTGTPWKGYDGLNEVEVVAGLPLANKTDVSDSITFDPGSANYVYNVEQDCAPAAIATTYPGGYWTYEYEPAGGNAALGANGKPLNAGEY
ncbi:MAG: hypothetical protein LBS19_14890, partial [Clostridiales bacterium]|nr:hypothetical protein [Clostridiales bacterium]